MPYGSVEGNLEPPWKISSEESPRVDFPLHSAEALDVLMPVQCDEALLDSSHSQPAMPVDVRLTMCRNSHWSTGNLVCLLDLPEPERGGTTRISIIEQEPAMYALGRPASGAPAFGMHLRAKAGGKDHMVKRRNFTSPKSVFDDI